MSSETPDGKATVHSRALTPPRRSQMVGRASPSRAGLQLHCTTPKKLPSQRSTARDDDVRSSRYHLLDEREQAKQAQEVERIVREIKMQQRPRATRASQQQSRPSSASARRSTRVTSRSPQKRSQHRAGDSDDSQSPPPYEATSRWSSRSKAPESPSSNWSQGVDDDDEGDLGSPREVGAMVVPLPAPAFQDQVLKELQKLKQAQQKDLEAIQRLRREKEDAEQRATALEATLRAQSQSLRRSQRFAFNDSWAGDESAPPPEAQSPEILSPLARYDRHELDVTDGEDSARDSPPRSGKWATPVSMPQRSSSLIMRSKGHRVPDRPLSARSARATSSGSHGPRSAREHRTETDSDEEDGAWGRQSRSLHRTQSASRSRANSSGSGIGARSSSRPRSASREGLGRSCSFFEEKLRAQEEEEQRKRAARERLERAARATPPANLLKRQEEARRKKEQALKKMEKEQLSELSPAKRVRAREVPMTTYVATNEEREQARKERRVKRSQDLLAHAELPARMKLAEEQAKARTKGLETAASVAAAATATAMSVKMRRRLQEQAEEEERRRQLVRPKAVPNFSQLQAQWEQSLSVSKSKHKPTEPRSFFTAREQELEELKARKEARKKKMQEQEELGRQAEAERQRRLLEMVKKTAVTNASDGPKLTKADELRMKRVQEALRQERKAKAQEMMEKERRELRLKEAARRVKAQVKQAESQRKGDYAGEFIELTAVEEVAKERAKKQRQEFREAVRRNKEKLLQAVATKPSLMERFAIDLKREEHKKQALETVVKQVFQKNLKDMKGILTEEEEEIARDLVSAEDDVGGDEGAEREPATTSRRRSDTEDGGGEEEDAARGGDEYENE